MTEVTRPKASAATRSPTATVVDIVRQHCATLRKHLDEWQATLGLSRDDRRFVLKQQRRYHRRALQYAKYGEKVKVCAILAVNGRFLERAHKHPRELIAGVRFARAVAPEIQKYRQRITGIEDVPEDALEGLDRLGKLANLFAHMRAVDEISRENQSVRAAKPRAKKAPTQRSETINVMRRSRAEGRELNDFLSAAEEGSIDGVTISPARLVGVRKYEIECNAAYGNPVSPRTLAEWWTEAGELAAD